MITRLEAWQERYHALGLDPMAIPDRAGTDDRPAFGAEYPFAELATYALSSAFARKVDRARKILDNALAMGGAWRASFSAGKDSTSVGILLALHGWHPSAVSCRDEGDFPGEEWYLTRFCQEYRFPLQILRPPRSLWELAAGNLLDDICSKKSELAQATFYRLLDEHMREGFTGTIWGIRSYESKARRKSWFKNGPVYQRADGTRICQPIGDWTTADVHAFLLSQDWPIQPIYLCCDLNTPWHQIRQDWYFVGGATAQVFGHYIWLRRWFPALWEQAMRVDPRIGFIS
jgi:3'-phosphoadenosine 5'-phosphosulfate sulfotransferase (PAPS reductase)/FAD synthetase